MTPDDWHIVLQGVLTAASVALVFGAIRWARRIDKAVTWVEEQTKNNGGATLRDAIDRIERRLDFLTGPVDES